MAEEVEMTPVEAIEPPKADPLAKPAAKIPTISAAKPTLKLPPKPGLAPGLKLPPKPGATVTLKPGLKLPTQNALKPGVKLPPRPMIHKPGATVTAKPLPKPITPMAAATPSAAPAASAPAAPVSAVAPAPTPAAPTAPAAEVPKPLEALKSVTQKMKGVTQEIPAQAILRKTGIIADAAMSEAQKEAQKHKTARISLTDAMGVAPVKDEAAPMKTIRIKRPTPIAGATTPLAPKPAAASAAPADVSDAPTMASADGAASSATITQRKTLKIARPSSGAVRPAGKFGIKRPPAPAAADPAVADMAGANDGVAPIADIADIPDMPMAPVAPMTPMPKTAADEGQAWLWSLSALVQAAACVAMGALAWFLFQNTQIAYF